MLLYKTFSVPPSEKQPRAFLIDKLLAYQSQREGFVLRVNRLDILNITISTAGNHLYEICADVETFLPRAGMKLEATVKQNRENAYVAVVLARLNIIFYSDQAIPSGAKVRVVLKEVKFQCRTYRATAELI